MPGILCSALARDCPLRRTFFASRRAVSPKRPPLLVDRCPLISTHRTFFACRRTPTNKKPRGFSNRRARAVVSSPHTASRWPRVVDRRRMFLNRPGDFTRLALRSVGRPARSANRRALFVGRRAFPRVARLITPIGGCAPAVAVRAQSSKTTHFDNDTSHGDNPDYFFPNPFPSRLEGSRALLPPSPSFQRSERACHPERNAREARGFAEELSATLNLKLESVAVPGQTIRRYAV